jgi:hypothetical protein
MILGTLASDKLVTTVNAILSEVFTEISPNKVKIFAEQKPQFDYQIIREYLRVLNVDSDVEIKVIGTGISNWKQQLSTETVDVADVTPGRKYMALALHNYVKAGEVRYVYLQNESKGYRPFGYVPFQEIKVVNLRDGKEIQMRAIKTRRELERKVKLGYVGIRTTLNMLSLLGKVEIDGIPRQDVRVDQGIEEMCSIWSGRRRFKEEKILFETQGRLIADTNVYINLGPRLLSLRNRILPASSTYAELLNKVTSTQRNDYNLIKFQLGMYAFRLVHEKLPDPNRKFGDASLVGEARALKGEMTENLTLITGDAGVMKSARLKGINVVFLHDLEERKEEDLASKAFCLSAFENVEVKVNGDTFLRIGGWDTEKSTVESLKEEYNYSYLSSLLTG